MPSNDSHPPRQTAHGRSGQERTVRRQLVALVLGILLPFTVMAVLQVRERWESERRMASRHVQELASMVAYRVDEHVAHVQTLLTATARAVGRSPARITWNDSLLYAIQRELEGTLVTTLWVLTPDGRAIGSSRRPAPAPGSVTADDRSYFQEVLRTRAPVVSAPLRVRPSGSWAVVFAQPVLGPDGEVTAVMQGTMHLTTLAGLMSGGSLPRGALVTVVDSSGIILARSQDADRWVGASARAPGAPATVEQDSVATEMFGVDGVRRLTASTPAASVPWHVQVGVPSDVAFASVARVVRRDLILTACTAALALLLAVAFARRFTRPLDALAANALAIASGDYERRASVTGSSRELTTLAQAFDTMAATIAARTEQLHQSERRYRTLFDTTPIPMFVFARDTLRLLAVNQAALNQYGYQRSEFLSLRATDLRPPEERLRLHLALRKLDEIPDDGSPITAGLWLHKRRDGSLLEVEIFSVTLTYEGQPARLSTAIDVTARRRAERALADSQERLRNAQKMEALGRFAGGIAHDFNNLLTGILGYCDLALDDLPAESESREDVVAIRSTAERAANLTRQILAFSRRQMLQPVMLDLNVVVHDMEVILGRLMEHHVTIELALAPSLSPVMADRAQLEQVILNLVLNARDAMPDGGKVRVETGEVEIAPETAVDDTQGTGPGAGSWVYLAVHDTGVGITSAIRSQILEPFFTTKERGKGTGLGLATVDGIVQQSGGVLRVESVPRVGSTFRIFLPRVSGTLPATTTPEAHAQAPRPHATTATILVAEDEETVRSVVVPALRRAGFAVLAARDGHEAVAMAINHAAPLDLLLTDVVMPGMMGHELARRLRRSQPGLRVLLTSGYTDDEQIFRELDSNGLAFLPKPFTPAQLVARVRALLDEEVAEIAPDHPTRSSVEPGPLPTNSGT